MNLGLEIKCFVICDEVICRYLEPCSTNSERVMDVWYMFSSTEVGGSSMPHSHKTTVALGALHLERCTWSIAFEMQHAIQDLLSLICTDCWASVMVTIISTNCWHL